MANAAAAMTGADKKAFIVDDDVVEMKYMTWDEQTRLEVTVYCTVNGIARSAADDAEKERKRKRRKEHFQMDGRVLSIQSHHVVPSTSLIVSAYLPTVCRLPVLGDEQLWGWSRPFHGQNWLVTCKAHPNFLTKLLSNLIHISFSLNTGDSSGLIFA